jgi:hypothetical protein
MPGKVTAAHDDVHVGKYGQQCNRGHPAKPWKGTQVL